MAIQDMWGYELVAQSPADLSIGTSAATYQNTGPYNQLTNLPGFLYKNTGGTAKIDTDGYLTLISTANWNPAFMVGTTEVQDWGTPTQYWIGFRTKTTLQSTGSTRLFAITDTLGQTNSQALLSESDMTSANAAVVNTEYYVEIFIDRTALTYQVYVNGAQIKTGALTSAALKSTGYYVWGGLNSATATAGATRCMKDFYFLNVDSTYKTRLGSIKAYSQPVNQVSAPNYTPYAGQLLNGAALSSAQAKFGAQSLLLNTQITGVLAYPDLPALRLGSTDCTFEAWVYLNANIAGGSSGVLLTKDFNNQDSAGFYQLQLTSGTAWRLWLGTTASPSLTCTAITQPLNTWGHLALVCKAGTWTVYWNGSAIGSVVGGVFGNNRYPLLIGNVSPLNGVFPGYVDELRISNIARYTAAFTPPVAAFTPDANTVLLHHFDGATPIVDNALKEDNLGALNLLSANPSLYGANGQLATYANSLLSAPSNDVMGLNYTPVGGSKVLAVDVRLSGRALNLPAGISPAIVQGGSTSTLAKLNFADSNLVQHKRLGLQMQAPDGGAWTPAKIAAMQLNLTPTNT